MEIQSGATLIQKNCDIIENGGVKIVNNYGAGGKQEKDEKPLTEEELVEKIRFVRPKIGKSHRLWFPVCKYMMWHSMVGDGDFVTAVAILERLYPELHLDADDLSSLNVLSFSKTLKEWNPNDAPVKGAYFSKYFLIANLLGG